MKKLLLFILLFIGFHKAVEAAHLKGGWIQYEYLGAKGSDSSIYRITVRQYLLCSSSGKQIDDKIYLGIFDGGNNSLVKYVSIDMAKDGSVVLQKKYYNPCIHPKPSVCYLINKYVDEVTLPNNSAGYTLAVQRCCRIPGIENVENSGDVGITYSNKIPGTINGVNYWNNSSPNFVQRDTALICFSTPFTLDFSATDPDPGDSIAYTFCNGLNGASSQAPGPSNPDAPPYASIPYNRPLYDGGYPLGTSVTIDPVTGIISGVAPDAPGDYVVAVCALEFRNGVLIGSTKKEIHITVGNCSLSAVKLNPVYSNCNSYTFKFKNEDPALSRIVDYKWVFGDSLGAPSLDTSSIPDPTHIYSDTGVYRFSLTVTNDAGCVDSAKSSLRVFPGFNANFVVKSSCIKNPFYFIDSSISKYGTINSWHWDMGETTATNDVFSVKDTSYTYPKTGLKTVKLTIGNTIGCTADTSIVINVRENPTLYLPFHDTVICNVDSVQLLSNEVNPSGVASFRWTPNTAVSNDTIPNPFVHPKTTTVYHLRLADQGCFADDTVKVNTVSGIAVKIEPSDTSICQNDSIYLYALTQGDGYTWTKNNLSNGLRFSWVSANSSENIKDPSSASPLISSSVNPTTYKVKVNLGNKCFAESNATVHVYPYPFVSAGASDSICYGDRFVLNGKVSSGALYHWTPNNSLIDSTTLFPTAEIDTTTKYYLTAYYTGKDVCPKPIKDSVIVTVIPKINISAGNDTTVVVNEPLHLAAIGTVDSSTATFLWRTTNTQQDFLDKNYIYNPTAIVNDLSIDSITYVVSATLNNVKKCSANDTVRVLVYQTLPQIFVPNVFMPNGPDGAYRTEKPTPVGVLRLDFFRVFDRYGKMLFSTSKVGEGWDGNYKGEAQPSGTYIYEAKGVDYRGIKTLYNKGTFVLIR